MNLGEIILKIISYFLQPFTSKFMLSLKKNKAVGQIMVLYENDQFIPIRFWDAPFLEVEKLIPKKAVILDLGCGEGFFTNFLALSSKNRKLIGVEIDKDRIKKANHKLVNAKFKNGDIV